MNLPTTIYLVRHGQTYWNVEERLQGQSDSPLTEEGLHQAHQMGEQFADIKFAAIYSSDIGRAKTTAEIIAQYHHQNVLVSDLIRERYFGKYEGHLAKEMEEALQDKTKEANQLSKDERLKYQFDEDIETDQELIRRLYRFFQKVHSAHPGEKLLTVSHAALLRTFLIYLDVARYGQMGYSSLDNLGYIIISTDGSLVELIKVHGLHLQGGAADGG